MDAGELGCGIRWGRASPRGGSGPIAAHLDGRLQPIVTLAQES